MVAFSIPPPRSTANVIPSSHTVKRCKQMTPATLLSARTLRLLKQTSFILTIATFLTLAVRTRATAEWDECSNFHATRRTGGEPYACATQNHSPPLRAAPPFGPGTQSPPLHLQRGVTYDPLAGLTRETWYKRDSLESAARVVSCSNFKCAIDLPYLSDRALLRRIKVHVPDFRTNVDEPFNVSTLTHATAWRQLLDFVVVRGSMSSFRVSYSDTTPRAARTAFESALQTWSEVCLTPVLDDYCCH
jgi:hypothetical protein